MKNATLFTMLASCALFTLFGLTSGIYQVLFIVLIYFEDSALYLRKPENISRVADDAPRRSATYLEI